MRLYLLWYSIFYTVLVLMMFCVSSLRIDLVTLSEPYLLSTEQKYYYAIVHPLIISVVATGLGTFLFRKISVRFRLLFSIVCLLLLFVAYYVTVFLNQL